MERPNWRRWAVMAANMAAPSLLCLSMTRCGAGLELLPWYLSAIGLSLFSLAQLGVWQDDYTTAMIPSAKEPVKFSETFAFSFFLVTLVIWIGGWNVQPPPPAKITTVVDIQFLSRKDAADIDSPLPGTTTAVESELRRRRGDEVTLQGNPSPVSAQSPAVPAKPAPREQTSKPSPRKAEQEKAAEAKQEQKKIQPLKQKTARQSRGINTAAVVAPVPEDSIPEEKPVPAETALFIPASWSTKKAEAPVTVASRRSQADSRPAPLIAEVEPPELVELFENDGDNSAMQVFQRGGDSAGGRGKENGLSRYLKELHRRIKSAWNPPKGTSRRVELTFRIKRDGSLSVIKVSGSSGEHEVDRSAIGAIIGATRKLVALPADYEPAYLDIVYTFNYNVDELREVKD